MPITFASSRSCGRANTNNNKKSLIIKLNTMKSNTKLSRNCLKMLLAVVLFSFISCDKEISKNRKVKFEQNITDASILKGTKYIETQVWITDYKDTALTLEYWETVEVTALKIDSVKKSEKQKALPFYRACLNYR